MRPFYLIAVIATRVIGVISMLILSHIMTSYSFGQFTLINTNALVVQMIMGSWLVSITNRVLVSDLDTVDQKLMSAIFSAALFIVAIIIGAAVMYVVLYPEQSTQAAATATLAIAFIICDTTLAVKNAVGRESTYATFAMYRNTLALVLSVSFVFLGAGAFGPVAGLLVGTAAPIILMPTVRSIWTTARPSRKALVSIGNYLRLGMSGGLILGIYILVNAPSRNIFAHQFGKPASGVWSLCADLFYGPLAVIGNAYGLSQIRLIYLAAAVDDADALADRTRGLMEFTLAIAVPYAVGCFLFANEVTSLLLSHEQSRLATDIAAFASMQGAVLLVLYSLASVALARQRFLLVAMMVVTTALAATMAALAGNGLAEMARLTMVGAFLSVLFWLLWSVSTGLVQLRWRELCKLIVATIALWAVSTASINLLRFPGGWIVAALAGGAAFTAAAIWLRLAGFIEVMPPAVRIRVAGLAKQLGV